MAKPNLDEILRGVDVNGKGFSKEDFTSKYKRVFPIRYDGVVAAFVGDSIMAGSFAPVGRYMVDIAIISIGSAIISSTRSLRRAYPGERSDQILARFDDIIAEQPAVIFLMVGTNDAAQGIPLAQFAQNIKTFVQMSRDEGIPIILGTVPPIGTTAVGVNDAWRILISSYNAFLWLYCQKEGIRLADTHGAIVNRNSGYANSIYISSDGIHPNAFGHQVMGESWAEAFSGFAKSPRLANSVTPFNLVTNPVFAVNTNNWYENPGGTGTAPVYSTVADTSGKLKFGNWGQMDFTATVGGSKHFCTALTLATVGLVPGDQVLITYYLDLEDVQGSYRIDSVAEFPTSKMMMTIQRQGFDPQHAVYMTTHCSSSPGPASYVYTIPEGMTTMVLAMYVMLATGRRVKFRIGEVGVFKITGMDELTALI